MLKTEHLSAPSHTVRQWFLAPAQAPFLEIRTTITSTLPYAEHFHSAFSIGLILDGQTRFSLEGTPHTAEAGDIVLIPPGRAHCCNPIGGLPRSYHMLLLEETWLREYAPTTLDIAGEFFPCGPVVKDAELFRKALAMVDAFLNAQESADAPLNLFLELYRRHCETGAPGGDGTPGETGGTESSFSNRQRISTGLFDDAGLVAEHEKRPSISRLAQAAGMRRESFSRAVRRKTGLSPSAYLHCLRLEKGRRMLRQGKSIAEVALAAGYADQSHFHRMFVKFYSVTPGCYRRGMSHSFKK